MQRPKVASGFKGRDSPLIHGSVQVERDVSKPCSRSTGETVGGSGMGIHALEEPQAGGIFNGNAQRVPLNKRAVLTL